MSRADSDRADASLAALAAQFDERRRRSWLATLLLAGAVLMGILAVFAVLGVSSLLWEVAVAITAIFALGAWLARIGQFDAAFWLTYATLFLGLLARPMLTGNASINALFVPLSVFLLVLVASPVQRIIVVATGLASLTLLILTTSDASTTDLSWSDLAFNGVLVSALTVVPGYLALRASRLTLVEAYSATKRAQRLTAELNDARVGLEQEVRVQTADLRRVLAETDALVEQLAASALRDYLTGLYNRRYLDEELPRQVAMSQRSGQPLGVAMIDLANFKQINDTYSHKVGDQVLAWVARRLPEQLGPADLLCRFGGDEFIVLFPGSNAAEMDAKLAAMERELTSLPYPADPRISVGLVYGRACFLPADADSPKPRATEIAAELLAHAGEDLRERRVAAKRAAT